MAETNDSQQQLHIAALAFPFGTHAAPLLTLLRLLATSLPPTTILSFLSTEKSNTQIFTNKVDSSGTIKAYNVWDGIPEEAVEGQVSRGNAQAGAEFFLKAVPGNIKKAMGEAETESGVKISCILSDAFLWFSVDLAAEMGVPWVAFWTAGSCALSVHMYTDEIRNTLGMPGVAETVKQTLTFIPGMSAVHIDDLPEGVHSGNLESAIGQMLHKMGLNLPIATAVVVNSFEELDPIITNDLKLKLRKVLHIGPSTLSSPPPSNSDEKGCLLWLEKQKPSSVAYISFGSMMTPPPKEMLALAQTLESLKVPFLWSLRDHSRHLLPEGFVERTESLGKVVSWAPQSQVLAHPSVGVFVSHCGWNSILESVAGGVPMICRPFFGDQTLNSRMVQDVWRIGIRVEGGAFTRSGTSSALELVLSGEEGKEMRESISGLKESAVDAVGPSGSSTANFETLVEMISVMFVGHLGELPLAGASMATSFASVTGFSLMIGMGSALDTFCGQSYGAKQYHLLGIYMQRAMFVLLLACIPLSCIWANTSQILLFFGQDPEIAAEAGSYARYLIPTIFAYAILQCHVRFLQAQNNVVPMMLSAGFTTLLHVFVCWVLVFKSGLGNKGAALANGISYWVNAILLAVYVRVSPSCKKTWTGFSAEALHDVMKFVRLAIPSAIMICLEIWSFEMMVLLSGLLPNPKLETSVLSICLNTCSVVYMIPLGLSGATSIRVSNELGAGRPQAARLAVCVVVCLVVTEGVIAGAVLILGRHVWGYCYSKEEKVVRYVGQMMILLAASHWLDGLQSVLSGTARGCGWQKIGAFANLGAYYLIGIPVGITLAFVCHIGGKGLWTGIIVALFAQAAFLGVITLCTNWEKEAKKASDRVYGSIIPIEASS